MGGIVARWRKKENGKDEEDKLGSKRNINGEVNENNAKEIEEELPNSESGKTVAEKLNDEVESREGDKDQLTSSQNKNLVKLENIVEPEKPPDLIFELDLYPEPPIILKQIRSHLQESDSVSEEVQKIFLTHPEKSFASKTKLKTQKSIFQPDVHLKELTNKWLLPFRIHLSSFPIPIVFLDVHFRQLTSFKQLKSKYVNQAIIIDASQNRIYSLDFVSINTSISSTTIVPQKENDEGKSLESTNAPLPVSIPTPVLYNQLLYLNISSNYLFSLFGIQCCPQLKCLIASDNMITSLWPLVHCTTLEYLDMKRNQLTHILHLNDILYIRKSSEYTPPQGAKVLSTDSRPTHLPESLTYLDVSYNQNLLTLTGLEPLGKLIHFDATSCSLTDITPLSQHLYLTYLSLASNQLADLHHVFTILQTLPSINSLHLYPNPFFSSLGTPVSHFSLTSYTIMFLHLYSKQLRELDHLLILPSDYDRLHSLLYQINQENLIDLLSSSNREILSNHMVNYNKLKSFHQVIERIFDNQIKVLQKDQQVMMTQQAEFIRSEIKMLKTVKSLNELYDLEEIKEKREKLIENGILQQQLRPKAIPEEISSSELSNVARNDLKDEMIGGSAGMDKEIVATGESHDRRVEIHEPKLLTSEPVEAIPPEPIQSSSRLSPQSSSPGSQCESRPSSSVSVPSPSPLPADSQEVLTSNHEKEAG